LATLGGDWHSASAGNPYFDMPGREPNSWVSTFRDDWKVTKKTELEPGRALGQRLQPCWRKRIAKSRTFLELQAINSPTLWLSHDDNHDFSRASALPTTSPVRARHILRGGMVCTLATIFQNIPLFMIQQANPTIYQGLFSLTQPSDMVPGTGKTLSNWAYGVDPNPTIPPPLTQTG